MLHVRVGSSKEIFMWKRFDIGHSFSQLLHELAFLGLIHGACSYYLMWATLNLDKIQITPRKLRIFVVECQCNILQQAIMQHCGDTIIYGYCKSSTQCVTRAAAIILSDTMYSYSDSRFRCRFIELVTRRL